MTRRTVHRQRFVVLLGVVLLAVATPGCDTTDDAEPDGSDAVSQADPTSTADVGGGGSGTPQVLSVGDAVDLAHVAVRVTVVDVQAPRLNTPSGKLPSGDADPSRIAAAFSEISSVTPVVVVVDEVLGTHPRGGLNLSVGDSVTIPLSGGLVRIPMPDSTLEAIGRTASEFEATDATTGRPVLEKGLEPSVLMEEDTQMLMFLAPTQTTVVTEDWMITATTTIQPAGGARGAYIANPDGGYSSADLTGDRIDIPVDALEDRARVVTFRTGPPLEN